MTDLDLDAIEARAKAAIEGPWDRTVLEDVPALVAEVRRLRSPAALVEQSQQLAYQTAMPYGEAFEAMLRAMGLLEAEAEVRRLRAELARGTRFVPVDESKDSWDSW